MNTMKTTTRQKTIMMVATAASIAAIAIPVMAASMGLVKIRVEESTDRNRRSSDALGDKRLSIPEQQNVSSIKQVSEKRSMRITISNQGTKPVENAKVKYWLFGRDRASRKPKILSSGEQTVTLPALGSTSIESKAVQLQQTDTRSTDHSVGQSLGTQKTGTDYSGYGVAVIDKDGKLVAEDFSGGQSTRELVSRELPVDSNPWGLRK